MATTIEHAVEHALDLMASLADIKLMQKAMDEMILMDWKSDKPSRTDLKFTVSPEARNAWLGALRILSSTDPIVSVPRDRNDINVNQVADQIEKICKAILYQSGRAAQRPVHYDLINSLVRYDEYHLAILDTQDLLDQNSDSKASRAERHRLEKLAASTPYLLEPMDVKTGYWERDNYGLTCYYRVTPMSYSQALNRFGIDNLEKSEIKGNTRGSDIVYHHDYWDLTVHYAWLDSYNGTSVPEHLLVGKDNNGKHELPYIPIVVQVGEASPLEGELKYRRQPLLYGVWKGSLWERLNLVNTIIYSSLFAVAANPMYIHNKMQPESKLEIDYSVMGGVTSLGPGENLQLFQRDVINKDLQAGLELAEAKFAESTMYKQVMGQPLGSNTSFSAVSLLSQSGRLPLVNYQRCGGWGIATALEVMFDLMKDRGKSRTVRYLQGKLDIDPKMLPEDLLIDVKLDADLPQDKLQQTNIASMLMQTGLVDRSWVRENVLNIGQTQDMDQAVQEERFTDYMFQEGLTNQMRQEIAQEEQQKAQQQAQQAVQQFMSRAQSQMQPPPQQGVPQGLQYPSLRARMMQRQQAEQQPAQPPQDISRDAAMGGLPPSARGLIPAQRPGEKPVPAEDYSGEPQEGAM